MSIFKEVIMKKALMIVAIVVMVAIAGSMIYYFVFYKPGVERAEIKLQEQKLEQDKEKQKIEEQKKQDEIKANEEKKASEESIIEEQKRKEEVEKYINDYNTVLSKSEVKGELSLDETINWVLSLMTKLSNIYVPEICDNLHNLTMQYWRTYYSSLIAYQSNDNKKGAELSEKMLELSAAKAEEARKLLR
jgi:uncharacterized FlaG/YvyC family protein